MQQLTSEVASLYATKTTVNSLGDRVTSAEASIKVNADNITSKVSKNGVISSINQSSESVTINASKINLNGVVTMSMLNSSLQTTINGKASSSSLTTLQNSLGSLAYKNAVGKALLDSTVISGGYLVTSLIDVNTLVAKKVVTNGDTYGVTTTMADGEISMKTSASVQLLRIYSNGSSSHIGLTDNSSFLSSTSMVGFTIGFSSFEESCSICSLMAYSSIGLTGNSYSLSNLTSV